MYPYNKRFIKLIRTALKLKQHEMSGLLGISKGSFVHYESGRSRGSDFFHTRMIEVFGIDLRQHPNLHKIVFTDPGRISASAYAYLSKLEVYDTPEQEA